MIGLIALAALAWLALIVLAPLLAVPLAAAAYLAGSLICHQLPERSFHIGAVQLPVCARCLGIYAAVAVTAGMRWWGGPGSVSLTGLAPRSVIIAGAAPTLLTVACEWFGLWQPSNLVRAIAGAPLGAVVAFVVIDAVAKLHYEPCAPQRPIAPRPPPTPI